MKKLCKNCGAKVPKKSDICKKCGEPYEYIDLITIDPETEKALQVEKPSIMLNVCLLILSILIFAYSLVLVFLKYTDGKSDRKNKLPDTAVSDTAEEETDKADTSAVHYNAVDFIGQPFSEVKKVLGEKYSIKLAESTLVSYIDFPVTLSTTDTTLSDDSVISRVIVTDNAQITPVVNADMTYDELKIVLALTKNAPEFNEEDAFYYIHKTFDNDICQVAADFKFDDASTDKAPIEVIISNMELTVPKVMGTVTGLDDYLNMRSEPFYAAESVHQLFNGDQVEILDTVKSDDGSEWYKIKFGEDLIGYSSTEFIAKNSEMNSTPVTEEANGSEEENDEKSEETEDTDDSEEE